MPRYFCFSVTLLTGSYHGRRDDNVPEWPPSPLRAYQSLVAAAGARWRGPDFNTFAIPALRWLENLAPPEILAPAAWGTNLRPYRLYVPNNAGDLVTKAWNAGNPEASIAEHRTEKDARPTHLLGDPFSGGSTVRFLWSLPEDFSGRAEELVASLATVAQSVTHLGWGIDMAAGHVGLLDEAGLASLTERERLERWRPGPGGTPLRVPTQGSTNGRDTLSALVRQHEAFENRMTGGRPRGVPPLTAYSVVRYRRPTDLIERPFIVFDLWGPTDPERPSTRRRARFSPWRVREVAGMLRKAVSEAAETMGWDSEMLQVRVHGHAADDRNKPARGTDSDLRFAYLPLPSVEYRQSKGTQVSDILRVMVTAHPSLANALQQLEQRLLGSPLKNEKTEKVEAILMESSSNETVLREYCRESCTWSTVTPVLLPGHDDHGNLRRRLKVTRDADQQRQLLQRLDRRTETLLRKAAIQSGFSPEFVNDAEFAWREVGFRRGVEPARRYRPPLELTTPSYHVRVRWPAPIKGPLVLGAGRYRGFGLFVSEGSHSDQQ